MNTDKEYNGQVQISVLSLENLLMNFPAKENFPRHFRRWNFSKNIHEKVFVTNFEMELHFSRRIEVVQTTFYSKPENTSMYV